MREKNRPLLITGFRPFLEDDLNPSELLVNELTQEIPNVKGLVLSVSFAKAHEELKKFWHDQGPFSGLIMLGQAGGRASVCLERIAVNWIETPTPDEDKVLPPTGPILAGAPEACINDFFPAEWQRRLSHFGPVQISFSAGTYVCNALYYRVLQQGPRDVKSLFVHVPYLPEQTERKPATPSMDLATQKKILRELIALWRTHFSLADS